MAAKFSPSLMCMDLTQFREQITAMNGRADFITSILWTVTM